MISDEVGVDRAGVAVGCWAAWRQVAGSRQVLEAIAWRFRTGSPWRDVPAEFGPWQTLWKRHRRWSTDGTYQRIFERVLAERDAAGTLDWLVSADATIMRAHQHATGAPSAKHGGRDRMTRSPSRTITASAGLGAG